MGIVVDAVSEVMNIKARDIWDTPNFGSRFNMEYILGMAKTGGKVKILFDIDKILSSDEVSVLDKMA